MSASKEKPIIMSSPMVRAILDGHKSVTRRVIKPQPNWRNTYLWTPLSNGRWINGCIAAGTQTEWKCPYQIGQILWVRETWAIDEDDQIVIFYRATDNETCGNPWRPSIHMPRKASRITLEITDIRVERVQEISEKDARSEGIIDGGCLNCGESEPCGCNSPQPDARDAFIYLWNSINEKHGFGWHLNPWVWVITFKRIKP